MNSFFLKASFAVRDAALFTMAVFLFLTLIVGLASVIDSQQTPKPIEVTPRLLDCDPDFYSQQNVRLKTEGFEPGEQANELRFRRRDDQPYVVILRFKEKVPDKLPKFVTGTCHGRVNGMVFVVDCR